MDSDEERRIRERAYDIWLREGRPHGRHAEHWETAKAEIAAEERDRDKAAAEAKKAATLQSDESAAETAAAPVRSRRATPRAKAGAKRAPTANGEAARDDRRGR
jgi:hypothetical protein